MKTLRTLFFKITVLLILVLTSVRVDGQNSKTYSVFFPSNVFIPSEWEELKLQVFISVPDSIHISRIEIFGFTDDVGNKAANDSLSSKRAAQIASLIAEFGVERNLIKKAFGKGEKNIDPNERDIEKIRAMNRRVDVTMYYEKEVAKHIHGYHHEITVTPVAVNKNEDNEDEATFEKKENASNAEIELKKRILPDTAKVGDKIKLPHIIFEGGTRKMLKSSYKTLDMLVTILKEKPGLQIIILGHICCAPIGKDGKDDDTGRKNLSKVRAKVVYEYLISKGIDKKRLEYKGLKANFKTGKGAGADRRVEIEIKKMA